ncbi:hypothetical protein FRC17_010220 [Serendipita sp. 399]|nr:hypothetical protein FRC17_010220 [Serendipita sp. 399]
MAAIAVTVTRSPKEEAKVDPPIKPAHHANDTKSLFTNPWPSFKDASVSAMGGFFYKLMLAAPKPEKDVEKILKLQTPTWGQDAKKSDLKATWLGHACFLVELPTPEGAQRGMLSILLHGTRSLYSLSPPCPTESIPDVDIVVISHNHYDHMDTPTLTTLREKHNPHFFAPLNNEDTFASVDIAPTHFHCLDWWEDCEVAVELPKADGAAAANPVVHFRLTCTPSQHQSARGLFDRFHTLWSSWAVEELHGRSATTTGFKVWFGGDTGYRHVSDGQDEDKVPVCPAFKEIGEKIGPFDLALIPIGAYNPREAMSSWHASPSDAVRIFQDIRAKKAIGMHWGTWVLTVEPIMEPPQLLAQEAKKAGLAEDAFNICGLGETVVVSSS